MERQQTSSIADGKHAAARGTVEQQPIDGPAKTGGHVNGTSVAPAAAPETFDEVAFLLDDINGLEQAAACNDNDQEYEIAGSQNDLDLTLQLDSPYESSWYVFFACNFCASIFSVRYVNEFIFRIPLAFSSVNVSTYFCRFLRRYSHANYRQYMNQMPSTPWGVPLHCDLRRLQTPTGIIRILLVVSVADYYLR